MINKSCHLNSLFGKSNKPQNTAKSVQSTNDYRNYWRNSSQPALFQGLNRNAQVCTFMHYLSKSQFSFITQSQSDSATPWTTVLQASLSITNSQSLLKLESIESVMPSNHLILSSPSPPAFSLFPASGSFPMSQFFASGSQSIRVSQVCYQG